MSKYIKNWNPRAVEAAVSGKLVERLDEVGEFVEERAKSLAPVRSGKLRANITHEVSAEGNYVEVRVGAKKPIFWAWFIEMGSRHQRASPFLRPAVWQNKATILRILAGSGGSTARAPARAAGPSLISAMKKGARVGRMVAGKLGMRVPRLPSLPRARLPSMPKAPNVKKYVKKFVR